MKVSIVIKALNEEADIARAIESSLKAIEEINGDGEVILADSLSTDQTIQIAKNYPIKIVQLMNESDRSCGVGAELGRIVSLGKFIYILDADMVFEEGFLFKAVQALEENEKLAGVGGIVVEMNLDNIEFQERNKRKSKGVVTGTLDSLSGGGLYRTSALESVKYFTHQGLNACEELELGARLTVKGWQLFRVNTPSVKHYGYQIDAYKLLIKRVKSGYIYGIGELLRSAYGKSHFRLVLKHLKQVKLLVGYIVWFLMILLSLFLVTWGVMGFNLLLVLLLVPFAVMSVKKKSIKVGVYSVISGLFNSYGLVIGFLRSSVKDPCCKINFKWVKKG